MPYSPDPRILQLADATGGSGFWDVVQAERFPSLTLRYRNDRAAATVGLADLTPAAWMQHLAQFAPLPDNLPGPLALRYHGHQFQHYNPRLGDGRGFLYAQLRDGQGRLLDLGTKGSGTTPWSRGGDGRLTLKGSVREILAAEQLEALGVGTCRIFAVFETGESLYRHDEPSPTRAAVLTRLSWSHLRFGTFQRLAYMGDHARLKRLVDYALATYYPELKPGSDPAQTLLTAVVGRSAETVAGWMVAGFVHGVLNTDNMNITGESFDYGPWRFLDRYDPSFTAAYFDDGGLYAYGRQPQAVAWNLEQLALALSPISDPTALGQILEGYLPQYEAAYRRRFLQRLGIVAGEMAGDIALLSAIEQFLMQADLPFDQFFFDYYGGIASEARAAVSPFAAQYQGAAWARVWALLEGRVPVAPERLRHAYFSASTPCSMVIGEVEALWRAIDVRDDWQPLMQKVAQIRAMGDAVPMAG